MVEIESGHWELLNGVDSMMGQLQLNERKYIPLKNRLCGGEKCSFFSPEKALSTFIRRLSYYISFSPIIGWKCETMMFFIKLSSFNYLLMMQEYGLQKWSVHYFFKIMSAHLSSWFYLIVLSMRNMNGKVLLLVRCWWQLTLDLTCVAHLFLSNSPISQTSLWYLGSNFTSIGTIAKLDLIMNVRNIIMFSTHDQSNCLWHSIWSEI